LEGTKSDLRNKQSAIDNLKSSGEEPISQEMVCYTSHVFCTFANTCFREWR
jgi:hypothetical protein